MTDKQWSLFFSLLADVVDQEGTWSEKRIRVHEAAREHNGEGDLEEFVSWFPEEAV